MTVDYKSLLDALVEKKVEQKLNEMAEAAAIKIVEATLKSALPAEPQQHSLPLAAVYETSKLAKRCKRPRMHGYNALISNVHKPQSELPASHTIVYRVFEIARQCLESGPVRRIELTKAVADLMGVEYKDISRHMTNLIERGLLTVVTEKKP